MKRYDKKKVKKKKIDVLKDFGEMLFYGSISLLMYLTYFVMPVAIIFGIITMAEWFVKNL